LLAYAGHAVGLEDARYQYLRYGATVVQHLRITDGPRVLSFMGYVDALHALDGDAPFLDLPAMGGSRRLRGWHGRRFSDSIATTATLQYQFAVNRSWSIALFTDVGNVFADWGEAGFDGTRLGYGVEWLWFAERGLLSRAGVGFSSEDTFLFNLSFSPSFAEQERL
jgi:outer membrane protein assembly factor BamA